jgi:ParB/RepB/Spo0J family partition protein
MSLATAIREFRELPIGLIDEPVLPARSSMDDTALDELASDIRLKGLLQPLIVAKVDDRYEVIAGHRRRIACGRAGLVVVPCIVYASKESALEGVKYSENRFREELSPAEEAILFSELLERDCGGDVDRLCVQLGEKRGYVENRLALFAGDPQIFEALQARKINIGVAQQLNRCTDEPIRRSFLRNAIQGGATNAVVAGWILDWRKVHDATPPGATPATIDYAPAPIPVSDPFKCEICGKNHHAHLLKYLPVHDYCLLAILQPMLEAYHGKDPLDGTGDDPRRG